MSRPNLLIDLLPESVEVDGSTVPVNSDFRTFILFELAMFSAELTEGEKTEAALSLFYPNPPRNLAAGIDRMLWFYRCGEEAKRSTGSASGVRQLARVYDFEQDDGLIYAAFLEQYNIDLNTIDALHWWKFKALFNALSPERKIMKVMEYRGANLSAIKDKETRRHYAKMQALYRLDSGLSETEKAAHAGAVFAGGVKR